MAMTRDERRGVPRPAGRVVGVASAIIVEANDARKKITFTNASANVMWISPGPVAGVGIGHYVAVGGTASDKRDEHGYIYTGPYSALALGAGSRRGIMDIVNPAPPSPVGVRAGTFTNDTANGAQGVTGVGFKPDIVIFFDVTSPNQFFGVDDGTLALCYRNLTTIVAASGIIPNSGPSDFIIGVIASMDADGFTITWATLTGTAPARTIGYLALKDS